MRVTPHNWDQVLKEFNEDLAKSDKIPTVEDLIYWLKSRYKPLTNVKIKIQTRSKSKGKKKKSPSSTGKRPENRFSTSWSDDWN